MTGYRVAESSEAWTNMLWLGWVDVGMRWKRGRARAIDEATALLVSDPRMAPHARGWLSTAAAPQAAFLIRGTECSVRVTTPATGGPYPAPNWVGVTPASDALAAGDPRGPLPMTRIEVMDEQGAAISGLMMVADGLFEPQEMAWGLRLPYESSVSRPGCVPVLASDRRPAPMLSSNPRPGTPDGHRVFRCENPLCRASGQEVLVPCQEPDALLRAGHSVAYPCPTCVGSWSARWALTFVRGTNPQDATRRMPVVHYPIRPTRRRRLPTAGPMQMVERSDTGLDLSKCVLPAMPNRMRRFLRSRKLGDLMGAMREDPVQTGMLLSGILTNENLRALMHAVRMLPRHRRYGGIATALAHGFFPRRASIYRLTHEATQQTHHQYIALSPETFLRKLDYYGVASCTGKFLDVGSGIGEKSFLAYALGGFSHCDGIEFDPRTQAIAQFLLQQMSTQEPYPIRFEQADALTFDRYGDYDVIYMFRPMHEPSFMNRLFRRIAQDMRVGATVYDVFRDDCALRKVSPDRFATTRPHPRTGQGVWDIPITLDEFLEVMGLAQTM